MDVLLIKRNRDIMKTSGNQICLRKLTQMTDDTDRFYYSALACRLLSFRVFLRNADSSNHGL
jgi:uncharacterized cysteine cluster protein YcgN (CxxCxxCC family)